jgi:type IV pilus assembly protein PilB
LACFVAQQLLKLKYMGTNKAKITLSAPEVEEKFSAKIQSIAVKEKEHEVERKAQELGLPYINLQSFPVGQEALELIPEDKARSFGLIPILVSGQEIRLGVCDPSAPGLDKYLNDLKKRHSGNYAIYLMSEHSLKLALELYDRMPKVRAMPSGVNLTEDDIKHYEGTMKDFAKVNELLNTANLTEFVAIIISGALEMRASDIHIETEETTVKVRYRIDGVLHIVAEVENKLWPKIISRLKLLSHLKLNIETEPQDGRFTIYLQNDKIDVRVSTIPTAYGESVVMRLLRSSAAGLEFDELGLQGKAYDDLKREIERPNGMIMATGPTGSGKTTTLYAILNKLNNSETKIITLEDPIEYKLKGVNQSQVEHEKGYDFAKGLRAILRQDPDVVMVGEIRDFETADIAINAALTGHLVISTIHTNSAAGAIPRFLAMGTKPFLLAPALNCIIGQRLVRKICEKCKEEIVLEPEVLERVKTSLQAIPPQSGYKVDLTNMHFYHGKGCEVCNGLGYKGRIGIYEIMTTNQDIEKLLLAGEATEYTVQDLAIKHGIILMVQDGLLKALNGVTTVEEVFKVAE